MQYMSLSDSRRQELWESLSDMHRYLEQTFAALDIEASRTPGPAGEFSPVEQVWHLADLEAEGFGLRIRRLRSESAPVLADFDGSKVARVNGVAFPQKPGGDEFLRSEQRKPDVILGFEVQA